MRRPRRFGGIEIKPGTFTEIPILGGTFDAGVTRAGIRRHQHDAVLGGKALRAGLDHEHFFIAGESGQVIQQRQSGTFRVRWHIHGKAHCCGAAFHRVDAADLATKAVMAR